jgi:DNA-directed RNA polymerase subunit RPC12/RpoP
MIIKPKEYTCTTCGRKFQDSDRIGANHPCGRCSNIIININPPIKTLLLQLEQKVQIPEKDRETLWDTLLQENRSGFNQTRHQDFLRILDSIVGDDVKAIVDAIRKLQEKKAELK